MSVEFELDTEGIDKLHRAVSWLRSHVLTWGPQGDDGRQTYAVGGLSVATNAMIQEYGVPGKIPGRSFLRSTFAERRATIAQLYATALAPVMRLKRKPIEAYRELGGDILLMFQRKLDSSRIWAKPNAASTLKKKGEGKIPLEDTGKLRDSLSWTIRSTTGEIVELGKV